jgi:hypothetical protein
MGSLFVIPFICFTFDSLARSLRHCWSHDFFLDDLLRDCEVGLEPRLIHVIFGYL